MSTLEDLLREWLPTQRWYGGKGTALAAVTIESSTPLLDDEPRVDHLVLRTESVAGTVDRYQLLLGRRSGEVEERLQHVVIGEVDGATLYDAVHDPAATAAVLQHLAVGGHLGDLEFTCAADLDTTLTARVLTVEQSNTSIVYGDRYVLKLFRRLQPGANPDIEVTKALADAGSPHVARPLAWVDGTIDHTITTMGLLQVFLLGSSEGWATATASVRDLFAEGDLHADEVGGDFAGEAERLGGATAEVHALMAQVLPTAFAGTTQSEATAHQLQERLDAALLVVPELAPYAEDLRRAYEEVGRRTEPVAVQRIHGDLHLGQVLRTQEGWVLLDFEGEPARLLSERTALMSPLRDVAGMLRSFDYAARHLLAERATAGGGGAPQLTYRAQEWAERNRAAFCDGYTRAAGIDPRDDQVLLRAFELDKAVYEVVYEARNRPTWLAVPLGSIERLVGARA